MSEKIYVKPNTGADGKPYKVRLPHKPSDFLPEEGSEVALDAYWTRRINDHSVVVVDPKARKTTTKE